MVNENNVFTYGSVFGGLITISNSHGNINSLSPTHKATITISDAVECLNYIHGWTTK